MEIHSTNRLKIWYNKRVYGSFSKSFSASVLFNKIFPFTAIIGPGFVKPSTIMNLAIVTNLPRNFTL
jgi:hypothetical protein